VISFADTCQLVLSPRFGKTDQDAIGIHERLCLRRMPEPLAARLAWHRENVFLRDDDTVGQTSP